MFTELIAKKCNLTGCPLKDQMQDKGLPICPECASELEPVTRRNDRLLATLALGATLVFGSGGALAFGMVIQKLSVVDAAKWLIGRISINEDLGKQPDSLLSGALMSESAKHDPDKFLICENRDAVNYCRKRIPLETGNLFYFDLTPKVDNLYVFYRGPADAVALLPAGGVSAKANAAIQLPNGQRMKVDPGAATESFVIVAAKSPSAALADLAAKPNPKAAEIDVAAKAIATQPDTVVFYVDVPHS